MLRFWDRLWLARRIMRGELLGFKADLESTAVTLDFADRDRARLDDALRAQRPTTPYPRRTR